MAETLCGRLIHDVETESMVENRVRKEGIDNLHVYVEVMQRHISFTYFDQWFGLGGSSKRFSRNKYNEVKLNNNDITDTACCRLQV